MVAIDKPQCPECGKSINPRGEYVEMSAMLVRGDVAVPIGNELYCVQCWYDLKEDENGEAEEDGQ